MNDDTTEPEDLGRLYRRAFEQFGAEMDQSRDFGDRRLRNGKRSAAVTVPPK